MLTKKIKLEDIKSVLLNSSMMILDVNGINDEKILEREEGKIIIHFLKTVKQNFNEEDFTILCNNFSNLNIIWEEDDNKKSGYYDSNQNSVVVLKDNYNEIYNAFFQAASTYVDFSNDNYIFSGFSQINNKNRKIGQGLNKGYTEYLSRKYFSNDESNNDFMYEVSVAKVVEDIIGEKIMQSLYLNASLEGLMWEMGIDTDKTYEFLTSLDSISEELERKKVRPKVIESCSKIVDDFLISVCVNKWMNEGLNDMAVHDKVLEELITLQPKASENKRNIISTSIDNYIDLYNEDTYGVVKTK